MAKAKKEKRGKGEALKATDAEPRKAGRPQKYTPEQLEDLAKAFQDYIEDPQVAVPIISEFCSQQGIIKQTLYDHPDIFSTLLKRCVEKKEARLERLCLQNKINTSMAIFSLKQLGWTDKQSIEAIGSITIKVKLPNALDN